MPTYSQMTLISDELPIFEPTDQPALFSVISHSDVKAKLLSRPIKASLSASPDDH